jgi:hypothetical protein
LDIVEEANSTTASSPIEALILIAISSIVWVRPSLVIAEGFSL